MRSVGVSEAECRREQMSPELSHVSRVATFGTRSQELLLLFRHRCTAPPVHTSAHTRISYHTLCAGTSGSTSHY